MPLYMDYHHKVDGLTAEAVAGAHQRDLEVQTKHGVNYLKYWFDEGAGKVFCLVEAPSKEAAAAVHQEAHGLGAEEIIEVQEGA
jgi:peptidyl-tRNA hydrolase